MHIMLQRMRCNGALDLLRPLIDNTSLLCKRPLPVSPSPFRRSYSTNTPKADNVECYISTYTDPFVNLAIEDYLFKTTDPEKYILYLWRNKPCVVVGRNQNPFKECNLQYMEENDIPLVRRRSGGGTVYHASFDSIHIVICNRGKSISFNILHRLIGYGKFHIHNLHATNSFFP
jgi:hypothetical protein